MILILCVCSFIGLFIERKIKKRLTDLESIERTVIMLKGQVKYKSALLEEAFEDILERSDNFVGYYIKDFLKEMKLNNGKTMKEIAAIHRNMLKNSSLKESDIDSFIRFMGNLGFLDKEMQLSVMEMYLEELKNYKDESREEIKASCKMYRYLGIFTGILICILVA